MSKIVDARGLPCPQPVILTRNALQEAESVTTIVDNDTARQNVQRMAQGMNADVRVETREDGIYLHIAKAAQAHAEAHPVPAAAPAPASGPLVVVIPDQYMGRGDDPQLGEILIRAFFHTLGEVDPLPDILIFFNAGVRLVVEGSAVLEDLKALCGRGVKLLACGTCLGHFGLKDKVAVGEISNMYTIAETMLRAGKVISL
ncbi:MAG: sulfurtransferase-like selenium metabolism protein YedF [Anaerolineales bacterium]